VYENHGPVIDALSPELRSEILDRAIARKLSKGSWLHVAGEPARRIYVLLEGWMKLSVCDGEGRASAIDLVVAGDLVGDVAALDGLDHPWDAIALTDCRVLAIDAERFRELVGREGRASLEWARELAVRVRRLAASAGERGTSVVIARLAGRLLDLADLAGRMRGGTIEIEMPLDQTDIGSLAGMSRESACRGLRHLQREGAISYEPSRLRIARPDVLERLRCAGRAAAPFR
jgi:CRP-like cAMP-binding protein